MAFAYLIVGILAIQVHGVKQHQQQYQQTSIPQYIPPQRFCGCEELNRCVNDQSAKDHNLLTACRQQCGSRIFLDPSLNKVVDCYETFDQKRSDVELHQHECVESMGSRQCISDEHIETPSTFTINTTEYLQAGTKRTNGHRKLNLPESVNQLNTCIRTCFKNLGIVQFNPDGTIVKANTGKTGKTGKNKENGEETQEQHRNGKENGNGNGNNGKTALCATLLNCQLSPIDKKLDKQAKQLCKYQPGPQEDTEMALCTCLETALGQNLYCAEQLSPPNQCLSPQGTPCQHQCPHAKKNGNERR